MSDIGGEDGIDTTIDLAKYLCSELDKAHVTLSTQPVVKESLTVARGEPHPAEPEITDDPATWPEGCDVIARDYDDDQSWLVARFVRYVPNTDYPFGVAISIAETVFWRFAKRITIHD